MNNDSINNANNNDNSPLAPKMNENVNVFEPQINNVNNNVIANNQENNTPMGVSTEQAVVQNPMPEPVNTVVTPTEPVDSVVSSPQPEPVNTIVTPTESVVNTMDSVVSSPQPEPVNTIVTPTEPVVNTMGSVASSPQPEPVNTIVTPVVSTVDSVVQSSMPETNTVMNDANNLSGQTNTSLNSESEDDLLKAFIGKNYEKITTKAFNFAGFFFSSFYLFYRKMFLYGVLSFILLVIMSILVGNPAVALLLNVLVGLFVNKLYVKFAKKKIAIIKASNPEKNNDEIKGLCAGKGGTSVGKVFLGILVDGVIAFVIGFVLVMFGMNQLIKSFINSGWEVTTDEGTSSFDSNNSNSSLSSSGQLENVIVSGHSCFGSSCSVSIEDVNSNSFDFTLKTNNNDLFVILSRYTDYIKLDVSYTKSGNTATIVSYKLFLKSTNEDISAVTDEKELRDKIGLFALGTHTESLKLLEIGTTGMGFNDSGSYDYTDLKMADNNNVEYEMRYINNGASINLVEGNTYTVNFEVVEGAFEYEYNIKSIN